MAEGLTSGDGALVVGEIHGPHGIRGEVRVEPLTDVADRFRKGAVLDCDGVGPLTIERIRGDATSRVVQFAGYATREAAATLKGRLLRVPRDESRRATKNAYLWADLIGASAVTPEGTAVGEVRDLLRAGGTDVLVIVDDRGAETLHPMIDTVVREVDLDARRIVLTPQEELT